jgi:hypothetical protein
VASQSRIFDQISARPSCVETIMDGILRPLLRIAFANVTAARAAADILVQHGFTATQNENVVVTDCPTLLAAPAIERSIGLELIERIDLSGRV